jgi:hypothetical protein
LPDGARQFINTRAMFRSVYAFVTLCVIVALLVYVESRAYEDEAADVNRLRQGLGIHASAVVLWPLLLVLLQVDLLASPVTAAVSAVALVHLSSEASVVSLYKGPLSLYEGADALLERSAQVCTVAFAVATLLFARAKATRPSVKVMLPVFTALLLCTTAAMPSAVARGQPDASGRWASLQRVAVSFSAGLMCVALAGCIDELVAAGDEAPLPIALESRCSNITDNSRQGLSIVRATADL